MRKVELVKGIESSILGFGCAPILGSVDGNAGKKALDMAFDYGITHFDLARSYGYGEAESFVGKVFQSKRDKIVITSKFGIKANWKAELLRPVKPLIRILKDRKKKTISPLNTDSEIKSTADLFHTRIKIDSIEMRKNLELSLKSLKTDYVDYFLIHEPLSSIENINDLCETAGRLKKEGKIRAWGLAYMKSQRSLHESYLDRFDILQFNNSPGEADYKNIIDERRNEPNIFFSPLRGGSATLSPKEKLQLLLNDFSKSVILCSMFNEKHLKDNIQLAQ